MMRKPGGPSCSASLPAWAGHIPLQESSCVRSSPGSKIRRGGPQDSSLRGADSHNSHHEPRFQLKIAYSHQTFTEFSPSQATGPTTQAFAAPPPRPGISHLIPLEKNVSTSPRPPPDLLFAPWAHPGAEFTALWPDGFSLWREFAAGNSPAIATRSSPAGAG